MHKNNFYFKYDIMFINDLVIMLCVMGLYKYTLSPQTPEPSVKKQQHTNTIGNICKMNLWVFS